MVLKLTGTDWLVHDTAKAVSYNGRVFGTLHFFQLLDLDKVLRSQGRKLLLDLKFEDWYDEEAHWPEKPWQKTTVVVLPKLPHSSTNTRNGLLPLVG